MSVIDPDDENTFKDILVRVQGKSTQCVRLTSGLNSKGALVVRLVWEERNFDTSRWPTSLEDITSGRVFRGAGQLCRLELDLLQISIVPPRTLRLLQLDSFMATIDRSRIQARAARSGS